VRRLTRAAALLLTASLCLTACGDDDEGLSVELDSTDSANTADPPLTAPVTEPSDLPLPSGEGEATCDVMFEEGRPTEDVVADYDAAPCTIDGEVVVSLMAGQECSDGRTLHFNELGWGYTGGEWQQVGAGEPSPPDGLINTCLGL
jgi:hypothetical protein